MVVVVLVGEGGGAIGGRKGSAPISIFENFLDIYLKKITITVLKIYWTTKTWKSFGSRVSLVAVATPFSTPY